jgi:DNA-binding response OmpR family regulator
MDRVLIVDDEDIILDTVGEAVEKFGFRVIKAKSATEALSIFHEKQPGIVITDLNLGGDADGVSLCSRIRYEDKSVMVLAMSGFFSEYDEIYCLEVGFTDFLVKPVQLDALCSAVQCAFDRRFRWKNIVERKTSK